MPNLLQQLENNEAILLMYLAGELPDADRAEVEQTLAADPALRAELAELAAANDGVTALLAQLDATRAPARVDAAARFVGQAVTAAAARRPALRLAGATDDDAPIARRRLRMAWWAYPVAAAAIVIIGIMIYPGSKPRGTTPTNPQIVMAPEVDPPVRIFPAEDASLADVERGVYSLRTGSGFFDEPATTELLELDR
jgi:anti-sigma factor RsiW